MERNETGGRDSQNQRHTHRLGKGKNVDTNTATLFHVRIPKDSGLDLRNASDAANRQLKVSVEAPSLVVIQ